VDDTLAAKYAALQTIITATGQVAVAYSGGVDSTLLLRVAADCLPGRTMGLLAATPLQTEAERADALRSAAAIDCPLEVLPLAPLSWPEFVANPADRCYHCKKRIYGHFLARIAASPGFVLMDGTNLDDLNEDRPGRRALQEYGIQTPLLAARLGKAEIRRLSRELGLSTWDKPSSSCLATRIAAGLAVSEQRLQTVAQCEAHLHTLGFTNCRVRLDRDDTARVELSAGDIARFCAGPAWSSLNIFSKSLGIKKLLLDLSERGGIVIYP